jgi:tol-pal system protein YbgF
MVLREFVRQHPKHELVANAHYWLGESLYVQKEFSDAAKYFYTGYKEYPKSGKAASSLLKLAMSFAELGKIGEACVVLRKLELNHTKTGPSVRKLASELKLRHTCKAN